jgi:hypothetical protein
MICIVDRKDELQKSNSVSQTHPSQEQLAPLLKCGSIVFATSPLKSLLGTSDLCRWLTGTMENATAAAADRDTMNELGKNGMRALKN